MYLKQNLKGLVALYAVAAFNAITAITTGTQHSNSTHIWINYIMFFKRRNTFLILFAWSLSGIYISFSLLLEIIYHANTPWMWI